MGGGFVAWGRSESGSEESTLVIRDVATGKDLPDRITRTRHASVAWLPGGKAFFYSRYPAPGTVPAGDERYSPRIYKHVVGQDPDKDELVFGSRSRQDRHPAGGDVAQRPLARRLRARRVEQERGLPEGPQGPEGQVGRGGGEDRGPLRAHRP
ncbi:MAG: hypothetical protein U0235_22890 [Polyangiaceae bacterium]